MGDNLELWSTTGDITVELRSGDHVTEYLFQSLAAMTSQPTIELFPRPVCGTMTIHDVEIGTLAFTGEERRPGKSWETWMAKDSERRQEVDRAAADARHGVIL